MGPLLTASLRVFPFGLLASVPMSIQCGLIVLLDEVGVCCLTELILDMLSFKEPTVDEFSRVKVKKGYIVAFAKGTPIHNTVKSIGPEQISYDLRGNIVRRSIA